MYHQIETSRVLLYGNKRFGKSDKRAYIYSRHCQFVSTVTSTIQSDLQKVDHCCTGVEAAAAAAAAKSAASLVSINSWIPTILSPPEVSVKMYMDSPSN